MKEIIEVQCGKCREWFKHGLDRCDFCMTKMLYQNTPAIIIKEVITQKEYKKRYGRVITI